MSASWTSCICNQPELLRGASSNLDKVQLHGLKGLKQWGEWVAGAQLYYLYAEIYFTGAVSQPLIVNPVCSGFLYKKSTGVCQQDRFYTLEMRERERDRERSFILSMPLHQHSAHIAFISDLATILCLHSFFLF